jgi:hypothetical protein
MKTLDYCPKNIGASWHVRAEPPHHETGGDETSQKILYKYIEEHYKDLLHRKRNAP